MDTGDRQSILFTMKMIVDRAATLFAARGGCRVTAVQGRVLMYMETHRERPVTQGELEKYMGISHATMKGILDRLEAKGYIRTAFDSRDGRVKNVYLTETMDKDKERVRELLQALEARVMEGISARQREELRHCMQKMYGNIL